MRITYYVSSILMGSCLLCVLKIRCCTGTRVGSISPNANRYLIVTLMLGSWTMLSYLTAYGRCLPICPAAGTALTGLEGASSVRDRAIQVRVGRFETLALSADVQDQGLQLSQVKFHSYSYLEYPS
ncbi:hypothetical protein FA13DRAFT_1131616 [Coprinellus micaceus]|uniref:Uncharacterized protein n=1 Tax=Coprinellus micaceus TaxID=71717 RepID=A0A4Y7SVB9_COPMI|nr:hypothetical protein FA13DRAFT_1131616 [Coprinellus micaceus]